MVSETKEGEGIFCEKFSDTKGESYNGVEVIIGIEVRAKRNFRKQEA